MKRSKQITLARQQRRSMRRPERLLWSKLRNRQLHGWKFRRQHPIGPFIVDFYCAKAKVAIELDGDVHDETRDRERDLLLVERCNCNAVARFSNNQVTQHLDDTLVGITKACLDFLPPEYWSV